MHHALAVRLRGRGWIVGAGSVHPGGRSDGRAAREMCLFAVQLDEFKKSPAGQVTTHLTESEDWLHAGDADYVPAAAEGQSSGAEEGKAASEDAGNQASAGN